MNNKYRLAIFDLDGTILDTVDDLTDSLNHMLVSYGFPKRTLKEVRSFVGDGIRKLIERAAPQGTDDETIGHIFDGFREYYRLHCADKTRPYDGIPELLAELRSRGMMTAVVSNKADYAVCQLCEKYFSGMFDAVTGERAGVARKPSPDSVNATLADLRVTADEAVYIGDSGVDIDTARNAGLECISVAWGFRDINVLMDHGAEKIARTADELKNYILC